MNNIIPTEINIEIKDQDDAELKLRQAVGILQKLRMATTKFDENMGFEPRRLKKRWEERADEFLNEINATNL